MTDRHIILGNHYEDDPHTGDRYCKTRTLVIRGGEVAVYEVEQNVSAICRKVIEERFDR